jgi:hypothetical protein
MQHGQGLVDQDELLPGKGPVGRQFRPGGGARAGCRGRSRLGLFPRFPGRGLLASLDGDPGGRED